MLSDGREGTTTGDLTIWTWKNFRFDDTSTLCKISLFAGRVCSASRRWSIDGKSIKNHGPSTLRLHTHTAQHAGDHKRRVYSPETRDIVIMCHLRVGAGASFCQTVMASCHTPGSSPWYKQTLAPSILKNSSSSYTAYPLTEKGAVGCIRSIVGMIKVRLDVPEHNREVTLSRALRHRPRPEVPRKMPTVLGTPIANAVNMHFHSGLQKIYATRLALCSTVASNSFGLTPSRELRARNQETLVREVA